MSMKKRLQVPLTLSEDRLFQSAAKIYALSAAEWARRVLRKAAERDLSAEVVLDPLDAVKKLGTLNGPVGEVDIMIDESLHGRLK